MSRSRPWSPGWVSGSLLGVGKRKRPVSPRRSVRASGRPPRHCCWRVYPSRHGWAWGPSCAQTPCGSRRSPMRTCGAPGMLLPSCATTSSRVWLPSHRPQCCWPSSWGSRQWEASPIPSQALRANASTTACCSGYWPSTISYSTPWSCSPTTFTESRRVTLWRQSTPETTPPRHRSWSSSPCEACRAGLRPWRVAVPPDGALSSQPARWSPSR